MEFVLNPINRLADRIEDSVARWRNGDGGSERFQTTGVNIQHNITGDTTVQVLTIVIILECQILIYKARSGERFL